MKYTPFAKTTKLASRLGFGGWQLGNQAFWSAMTEEEGIQLVQKAVEEGITLFDTAPGYASGLSETILGKALKPYRDKVIIMSKFGHKADGTSDFASSSIEKMILESCERLQTTYLDCLLLHNPDEQILLGRTDHFKVLKEMQTKGLIRSYGVSIDNAEELKLALTKTDSQVIEVLFNVFFQDALQYVSFAKAKKISLIAKVPLDSGWLTGKFDENSIFTGIRSRWTPEIIKRRASYVKSVQIATKEQDITKYALGFIYSYDAFTTVIPGMRTIEQLMQNISYESFEIPYSVRQALVELYSYQIKNKPLTW